MRFADYHMADKNEFRSMMCIFYRLRVERDLIKPNERMFPESEKFVDELVVSFRWRDEWLQDEELCKN